MDNDEMRRAKFMWGGSRRDLVHMIASKAGQTDDIKTGIPPKMKADTLAQWLADRDQAEIERMFSKPLPVERTYGVWYKDGEIPH